MPYQNVYKKDYSGYSTIIWKWKDSPSFAELNILRQRLFESDWFKVQSDEKKLELRDRFNETIELLEMLNHLASK